ncbi:diguanylate cyclase domain-containing protein [Litorivivens sp.]|uniref:GGDEF domain-containing protein n=1 Tax=Litorivivens sp. TaxID=2020868 RepID=UPI003561EC97
MKRVKDLSHTATRDTAEDIDAKRLRYVFNLSTFVGGLVLLLFAFRQLESQDQVLRISLFLASAGVWLTFIYVRITQRVDLGVAIASALVAALSIALVYTGGENNSGLFWVFPLLFIQFIYLGAKRGLAVSVMLLVVFLIMLGNADAIPATYDSAEVTRAMAALITLMILAAISEFYRHHSHLALSTQHTDKVIEAVTDPLTGLTNRRFLDSFFFPDCMRQESAHFPLTVIACDIDNFKLINDRYGHKKGDDVLVSFAAALTDSLRSSDVISRVGGEEFLILVQRANEDSAREIAEKLRARVEQLDIEGFVEKITASFGVVVAQHYSDLQAAMLTADQYLYRAKKEGRNRVVSG